MTSDNTLNRFVSAQQDIYAQAVKELHSGKKTTHWMWFIFPQIDGLGHSPTAKYYSVKNIEEAKEYAAHPVLGKRLLECCNILLETNGSSADEIFGYPDNLKLKSCLTLFNYVATGQQVFGELLKKYFGGEKDEQTLSILIKM
jgi:uncharacterized protein (DUF1810 family)